MPKRKMSTAKAFKHAICRRTWYLALAAAGATLAALTAAGKTCYYKPDSAGGSGAINAATRWDGDVPDTDDIVYFEPSHFTPNVPMNITISAEDWDYLKRVGRLQPRAATVTITFDLGDEDVSWGGQIYGPGTFVKKGAGAFRMTRDSSVAMSYSGRLIVSNGLFRIGKQYQNLSDGGAPIFEVCSPGVLQLSESMTWARGLCGNGSVTNSVSSSQIQFLTSSDTFEFSGRFLSAIGLSAGTVSALMANKDICHQYFTMDDYERQVTIRLYNGFLGAKKFGMSGESSSFGGGSTDSNRRIHVFDGGYRNAKTGLVNLGTEPQTTDRIIRFINGANGFIFTFDGGVHGGVTLQGEWQNPNAYDSSSHVIPLSFWKDHVTPIYLTGQNADAPCVIAGAVIEDVSTNHLFFTKQGSGTWRFAHHANRQFKTPVAVERGTLEYETIAEAGINCSLGRSTVLSTNWTGTATELIDHAFLVGDGTAATAPDLATFSYVGTSAASCSTRPIGIIGAGRVLNATDQAFYWRGVSAASPGSATLVLDGAAHSNAVDNVTDGQGTLSVEKRGAGTWRMDGALGFSGPVSVKAGKLDLKIAPLYTWYRLTIKAVYNPEMTLAMLGQLAFLSADGTDQTRGKMTYNSAANGNPALLQKGQIAFATSGQQCHTTTPNPGSLFSGTRVELKSSRNPAVTFNSENPNTWISFVIRLPADAEPVVAYDIMTGWYTHSKGVPYGGTPTEWTLEGSQDGVTWNDVPLDSHTGWTTTYYNPGAPNGSYGNNYWLSDATIHTEDPTGFTIASEETTSSIAKLTSLPSVSVAANATLSVDRAIPIHELSYDAADGAGTIKGFSFAENGTLRVTMPGTFAPPMVLGYDFDGCSNVAAISGWSLYVNGSYCGRCCRIRIRNGKISIEPAGMTISFR